MNLYYQYQLRTLSHPAESNLSSSCELSTSMSAIQKYNAHKTTSNGRDPGVKINDNDNWVVIYAKYRGDRVRGRGNWCMDIYMCVVDGALR